jgi:dolichol-phosphate mannosyltransferase
MKDMTSGFECFTHRALSHIVARGVESRAHFFQTEIRCMLRDWRWVEIPIGYANPSESVGNENVREALRILFRMRKASRSTPGERDPS